MFWVSLSLCERQRVARCLVCSAWRMHSVETVVVGSLRHRCLRLVRCKRHADTHEFLLCLRTNHDDGPRYMLGMLSSVLEEVETAFDGYQFYKASQVTKSNSIARPRRLNSIQELASIYHTGAVCVCKEQGHRIWGCKQHLLVLASHSNTPGPIGQELP